MCFWAVISETKFVVSHIECALERSDARLFGHDVQAIRSAADQFSALGRTEELKLNAPVVAKAGSTVRIVAGMMEANSTGVVNYHFTHVHPAWAFNVLFTLATSKRSDGLVIIQGRALVVLNERLELT